MMKLRRPPPQSRDWEWFPSAASAVCSLAVAVAFLVLRSSFLDVAGRLGIPASGQRIFSVGAFMAVGFTLLRAWRDGRRAWRLYRGGEE